VKLLNDMKIGLISSRMGSFEQHIKVRKERRNKNREQLKALLVALITLNQYQCTFIYLIKLRMH
jgi:hypothetical protein